MPSCLYVCMHREALQSLAQQILCEAILKLYRDQTMNPQSLRDVMSSPVTGHIYQPLFLTLLVYVVAYILYERFCCTKPQWLPRTALILFLLSERGSAWVLEQPAGSLLHYHPRIRWLFRTVLRVKWLQVCVFSIVPVWLLVLWLTVGSCSCFLCLEVWKVKWWMGRYGSATPKPHVGYSNCAAVGKLNIGGMSRQEMKKLKEKTTSTRQYLNRRGRKCWVGTKALKGTQPHPHLEGGMIECCAFCMLVGAPYCRVFFVLGLRHYPPRFGRKLLRLRSELCSKRCDLPPLPDEWLARPAEDIFGELSWDDVWHDAAMPQVLAYLMGNTNMCLPQLWRQLFPAAL